MSDLFLWGLMLTCAGIILFRGWFWLMLLAGAVSLFTTKKEKRGTS